MRERESDCKGFFWVGRRCLTLVGPISGEYGGDCLVEGKGFLVVVRFLITISGW